MAKKKNDLGEKVRFWNDMEDKTVRTILALFSFLLMVLSLLAAFGKAGFGNYVYEFLMRLFGVGYYLIPVVFAMLGVSFLQGAKRKIEPTKLIGMFLFFISGLALIHISYAEAGGIIGRWIASPLIGLLDTWAAIVLLIVIFVVSIIMTFNLHITLDMLMFWKWFKKAETPEQALLNLKKSGKMDKTEEGRVDAALASLEQDVPISNLEREELARVAAEQKKRDEEKARTSNKKSTGPIFSDDDFGEDHARDLSPVEIGQSRFDLGNRKETPTPQPETQPTVKQKDAALFTQKLEGISGQKASETVVDEEPAVEKEKASKPSKTLYKGKSDPYHEPIE